MKKILVLALISTSLLSAQQSENYLLKQWAGPYGGVPAFDQYKINDFKPAFDVAIKEYLSQIDKIGNNTKPPTFENTIAELERSGSQYERVFAVYGIYSSSLNSPEFSLIESDLEPIIASTTSKINQNKKVFNRIETLYKSPKKKELSPEQQRLIWKYYSVYQKEGASLDEVSKQKVSDINKELAGYFSVFSQNLLAEENNQYVGLNTDEDFEGLPEDLVKASIAQAKERGGEFKGYIGNTRSFVEPFLTFSTNRLLREKVWRMFVNRGDNNNEFDNKSTLVKILQLRAEKAKLLGYPTFAHWNLSDKMAKTPEKTMDLMLSVWEPALVQVRKDVEEMQKIVVKEGKSFEIAPWDYRYYAEIVRKEKYDLDQNVVKEYLQLEKLREGMFWVAGELFNLDFKQVYTVPVFHSDVRVWEVLNKDNGKVIGLWYFDPYARKGKRSGAWMNAYRKQERMDGEVLTLVSNNSNFIKSSDNAPVLISWIDATTLFHEFGHALHGLCSNVTYPKLSGTAVARDYVEFPSQILERWLETPEVLNKFALHYKTNQPIPMDLVDRIAKASTFNEGFSTVETISSSLVDMKLHLVGDTTIDPTTFEKNILDELAMPKEIVMRHRIPQFGHIFSSDGYASGYYGYLWADVISADAYDAFTEGKGPYDKQVAKKLFDNVFSVGNTIDEESAYRAFRGRDANSDALMKARGFAK